VLPRWRLALGLAIAVAIAGGAWLALRDQGETRSGGLIDDKRGAYGGVTMGDSEEEVHRAFGEPSTEPGFAPAGKLPAEVGGPQSFPARVPFRLLKYEDVGFLLNGGVYAFIVANDGAETTRGVAIGEAMDEARRSYRLKCIRVAGGESLFGGQEFYPSCSAALDGGLRIWFGRDPIKSITLVRAAG
jgi:hypothetical protein